VTGEDHEDLIYQQLVASIKKSTLEHPDFTGINWGMLIECMGVFFHGL
jgi:hypothetical protein